MDYAIVNFTNDNTVEIIPEMWILPNRTTAYYPPRGVKDVPTMTKKKVKPDPTWPVFNVAILHHYSSYSEAMKKLSRAEETSNLSSEEGQERCHIKRIRRKAEKRYPGECSSDDVGKSSDDDNTSGIGSESIRKTKNPHRTPSASLIMGTPSSIEDPRVGNSPNELDKEDESRSEFLLSATSEIQTPKRTSNYGNQLALMNATIINLGETIRKMDEKLDSLINSLKTGIPAAQANDEVLEMLETLPIKEEDLFNKMEEDLKNPIKQKSLLKILMSVGGKNLKQIVNGMLRRLMVYNLAVQFSYTGAIPKVGEVKIKKRPFCSTTICKMIHIAVKKIDASATDTVIKTQISLWLQQSKFRMQQD